MNPPAQNSPRSAQTRQRIFRAAAEAMLANGYAGTSLAAIAERLELTKGALARHVPVKTVLIEEFAGHLRGVLDECDARARAAFPRAPSRACVAFLVNVGFVATQDVCTTAAIALAFDPSVPTDSSGGYVRRWIDLLTAHLAEATAEEGHELNASASDAAEFLTSAVTGMWVTGRFVHAPDRSRLLLTELALIGLGFTPETVSAIVEDVLGQARSGSVDVRVPEASIPRQWWRGSD